MSHEEIMSDLQSPNENNHLDLVNVVRCKDCKYFDPLTEDFDYNFCDAWAGGTNEDMFCGFAERRQDADSSGNMSGTHKNSNSTETHSCDYQRTETHDLVSRLSALEAMDTWDKFGCDPDGKLVRYDDDKHYVPYVRYEDMVYAVKNLPSVQPERMTNRQWIDFLSVQFDISRTSAKEMLHGMMQWKKEDNFKKMFNGGKT